VDGRTVAIRTARIAWLPLPHFQKISQCGSGNVLPFTRDKTSTVARPVLQHFRGLAVLEGGKTQIPLRLSWDLAGPGFYAENPRETSDQKFRAFDIGD
jgi:hypothetical protein